MLNVHSKRILYVQYTNPAAYPPLQHSSRLLADKGWRVMFLGIFAAEEDVLRFPDHENITVRQLPFCPPGLRQKLHYLWFSLWVVGWTIRWRPQWIYVSDLWGCPVALLLSTLRWFRIIYHEHDSPNTDGRWADDNSSSEIRISKFIRLCLWARERLAARTDCCVLPNQERISRFRSEVGNGARVFRVWNCPQSEEIRPPRSPRGTDRMIVYYHGVLSPAYVSLSVLKAIAMLPPTVHLRVIGYETVGSRGYLNFLKRSAQELGIADRIEVLGPMPRYQALTLCSQCDVGLALIPKGSHDVNNIYKMGASNKPFDYLACGLALLVSDLPDWQAMYVGPGYGLACDPDSPESIAASLRWFLDRRDETHKMGEVGRQRILAEWNYERQFQLVLEQLNNEVE